MSLHASAARMAAPGFLRRPIPRSLVPSVLALTAANLAPLGGVLWLGWQVFPLLFLFWTENVVVGVFNVLRMLLAQPTKLGPWIMKVFVVPFFCGHYGAFTAVHGVFVIGFFGQGYWTGDWPDWAAVRRFVLDSGILFPFAALTLSHAFSFGWNYIGQGEYRTADVGQLMAAPYARVVVMHLTIIFGAFLIALLGSPVAALVLLINLKIVLDVGAHVGEHAAKQPAE